MSEQDVPRSSTIVQKRVQQKLTLDARQRFILLFALFNAMFLLLFVLLLQNRQLADHIEVIEATSTEAAGEAAMQVGGLENEVEALEDKVEALEDKIGELLLLTPTTNTASPIAGPVPNSLTTACSATAPPTPVPSRTSTPVSLVPTDALLPPMSTAPACLNPSLFSITPSTVTIATNAITVTLQGSAFAPGAVVEMQREGELSTVAVDVNVISPTQIVCVLDLTRIATGTWSVRVINPGQRSDILPDAFRVYAVQSR
jgi:hypothetical protein